MEDTDGKLKNMVIEIMDQRDSIADDEAELRDRKKSLKKMEDEFMNAVMDELCNTEAARDAK